MPNNLPSPGIKIINDDGTVNYYWHLFFRDFVASAITGVTGTGYISFDGSASVGRIITANSSKIAITNGTGIAGNTTVDVQEANLTLSNMGGTLGVANGGTALTATPTNGQLLIGNATNYTLATVTGTANQITVTNGAGSITLSTPQNIHTAATPTFSQVHVDYNGLRIKDSDASHELLFVLDTNLTSERALHFATGDVDRTITLTGNTSLTGTNTGDQTITLTGDVTGSGTGSFAATVANDTITYAKIQNISATDKLLGRSTSGAGDVEEIACTAAGRAILDDATASDQRTTLGLADGTYSAAYTNVANLDSTPSNTTCQYMRVGNTVTVSGTVTVDPTAATTSTQVGISIPIASDFGSIGQCAGTAFASGIASQGAAILADVTNNRAQMQWISSDTTSQAMYFTFTYLVV